VPKKVIRAALIAHGGAGRRVPVSERQARQRGLIVAVERGAAILREGGSALDAVTATVAVLEGDGLFNAGYGATLTIDGKVEMDAAVMVAERRPHSVEIRRTRGRSTRPNVNLNAGGVVLVSRVRNPILLARAVMERTPHVLIGGAAAERLARDIGMPLCRPQQLVSERARKRWLAVMDRRGMKRAQTDGTVGAAALDQRGNLAAATSTGGMSGKMAGRIGDSAIIGAGLAAARDGAASATGSGEAIMKVCLCRQALALLSSMSVQQAAVRAISELYAVTRGAAGLVMVDSAGQFGYAHNAQTMEIALCGQEHEVRHLVLRASAKGPTPS